MDTDMYSTKSIGALARQSIYYWLVSCRISLTLIKMLVIDTDIIPCCSLLSVLFCSLQDTLHLACNY